ncbi:hypothetical protein [Streptomyces abyssomicinicus]|uniref:hypothetical protein n=1 Tax=Streptomyces abyssomicinicus TaxID=574929 RepID=UPI001250989B|nr:hypothetical protein [Streptomyces abyssomicinicus]
MPSPVSPNVPPSDTKVLSIGLHPRSLDYSDVPDGINEATLTARIEAANAALREAEPNIVPCLVDADPDSAEAAVRTHLADGPFGLAMIGGAVRMLPQYTLLFERLVNVLTAATPGIRLCFNTAPENTLEAIHRWLPRS